MVDWSVLLLGCIWYALKYDQIECPNHGQSAVMNGPEIDTHFGTSCKLKASDDSYPYILAGNGWEYPRAMKAFIDSRPVGVDFYKRTLVALGHSSGGNSLYHTFPPSSNLHFDSYVFTSTLLHHLQPNLDFKAFILLDPTLGKQSPERDQMQRVLSQIVWNKKDTWPSRAAALKELSVTPGYRNWHPDTLKLFVVRLYVFTQPSICKKNAPGKGFACPSCQSIPRSVEIFRGYIVL